jgi:hypothetical protein
MNDLLYNLSKVLAHSVMYFAREEAHGDPLGFDFSANTGQSSQQSNTQSAFQRQGTTTTGADWNLPAWLSSLIQSAPATSAVPSGTAANDWSFITNLLQQDPTQVYGAPTLDNILNISPNEYDGRPALDIIQARNPYSTDYENQTRGLYDRQFEIARSNAQSGPANVRGGQARVGFDLADVGTQESLNRFREIRQQSDKEAGVVEQATHIANTIESMRRSSQMQAQERGQAGQHMRTQESLGGSEQVSRARATNAANLQLAAELLGLKQQQVVENLSGQGQQIQNTQGSSFGMGGSGGVSCCFIFLEALNGELPYYVRWGRDDFQTPARRRGYVWMSKWLVPWMKRSVRGRSTVNLAIIRPFLVFGHAHYVRPRPFLKPLVGVYCWMWFLLWSGLGHLKRNGIQDS